MNSYKTLLFMKNLLLATLACTVLVVSAQAQTQTDKSKLSRTTKEKGQASGTSTVQTSNERPADFPKYMDTGNPETDQANYAAAKKAWFEKNGNPPREKKIFTQQEFDRLPENKKQHILSHPERYEVK